MQANSAGASTARHPRHRDGAVLLVMAVLGLFAVGLLVDSVTTQPRVPKAAPVLEPEGPLAPDPGVVDTFARVDTPTSLGTTSSGSQWLASAGVWGISGNSAYVATANTPVALTTVRGGTADGVVGVTVAKMAPGAGLVFRCVNALNCWRVEAIPQFGTWNVVRIQGGVETKVATLGTVPVADGTRISVRMSGPVLTFLINGNDVTTVEDAAFKDADGAGLSLREASSAATARWSKFAVEVVVVPGIIDEQQATFVDTFDRSDADTLGAVGSVAWSSEQGTWGLRNKRAQPVRGVTKGSNLALVDVGTADGIVEATIFRPQQAMGIAFRCKDANNCWRIEAAVGFGTWNVTKVVDGTVSKVATLGLQPTAAGTTISVRLEGTTVRTFINGAEAISFQAQEFADVSTAGLVVDADPLAATAKWSSFRAGPLGAMK